MDPFAAIGLASNIISFVDYSTKIVNGAREIYDSTSGMTQENKSLESIVSEMKELSSKLLPHTGSARSENEEALCRIAAECNIISDHILEHLSKTKPKDSKSKRDVLFAAVKNKFREKERLELEKRLANCRSQLDLQLNFLTSSDTKAQLKEFASSSEGASVRLEQLIEALRKDLTVTSISSEAQTQLNKLLSLSGDAFQAIIQQRIINSLAFEGMHGRFEAVDDAHYQTFEWIFQSGDGEKDALRRSTSELFKSRLRDDRNLYQDHCFCYFIDGLDEYEETRQEDYKSIVEILSDWTLDSAGSVKICVSSREYNVFLNGFSSERRFRLQDLTGADMELYVRNKLPVSKTGDFEQLIRAIVEKGDGIFLWVALVVKTLRERIGDGHDLRMLKSVLNSLPRELENLLKSLLNSLDACYKRRFYQLFAMLSESKASKVSGCLSPLACSFLENFDENPNFAMEADFPCFNMEEKAKVERETLAQKNINGYCKGLLEFKNDALEGHRLVFAHRSIPEFLETPSIQTDRNLCLKNYNAVEAISQLLLAKMRCTSPKSIPRGEVSLAMYRIVALREGDDSTPV